MAATTKIWVNGSAPTCEDDDLNGFKNENNNLIVGAGISLSTADNEQTHKAVSHFAAGGDFYIDSGSGLAAVLSPVGAHEAPPAYFTGMRVRYIAAAANSNDSMTINVAGLGVKNLYNAATGSLWFGDIVAGQFIEAVYDGTQFNIVGGTLMSTGFWTPTVVAQAVPGAGWTYTKQDGAWARSGNIITYYFDVATSNISSGAVGGLTVAGIPYQELVYGSVFPGMGTVENQASNSIALTAGYGNLMLKQSTGTPGALVVQESGSSGIRTVQITDLGTRCAIRGSMTMVTRIS